MFGDLIFRSFRAVLIGLFLGGVLIGSTYGWRGFFSGSRGEFSDETLPGRLKGHVIELSHKIGDRSVYEYEDLIASRNYIASELEELGFVIEFQEYISQGKEVQNIIARKKGLKRPEEIVIVGAHYDTCFNPGANDNASGVAGLLELARSISEKNYPRTIELIAFVNEETPFFQTEEMGSLVYAQKAHKKDKNIKAAVILEMIGYYSDRPFSQRYPPLVGYFFPSRANFIAFVGNLKNRHLVQRMHSDFKEYSNFPVEPIVLFDLVPGVEFSDHWSFWQYGFPAAMVTDTAFYRYEHYHEKTDTFEKLDYRSMAKVVEGLHAVVSRLASE